MSACACVFSNDFELFIFRIVNNASTCETHIGQMDANSLLYMPWHTLVAVKTDTGPSTEIR